MIKHSREELTGSTSAGGDGGDWIFPEGEYTAELLPPLWEGGCVQVREPWDNEKTNSNGEPIDDGTLSDEIEEVSIRLGNCQPVNGSPEVGNANLTYRIVVRDGGVDLESYDGENGSRVLKKGYGKLLALATALDQLTEDEDGSLFITPGIVDKLRQGDWLDRGLRVKMRVKHAGPFPGETPTDPVRFNPWVCEIHAPD